MKFRITFRNKQGGLRSEELAAASVDEAWDRARLYWGKDNIVSLNPVD